MKLSIYRKLVNKFLSEKIVIQFDYGKIIFDFIKNNL